MPKPVKKSRRFIDKKRDNVSTFRLVHRSQRDPLATDVEAPQRLLQPMSEHDQLRQEEQKKFGIYFDDNYDYLQHLRDKDQESTQWDEVDKIEASENTSASDKQPQKKNLNLPSSVFATEYEEDVGLLNRAAPRSGPLVGINSDVLEILETLDDDFEVEEVVKAEDLAKEFEDTDNEDEEEVELDDILADMVQGTKEEFERDDSEKDFGSDFYGSENEDEVPDMDGRFGFGDLETRSKFTEYSMSSSVTRRSEQLVNLDDKFEKFYDAYEEENMGGLDYDDIEGFRPETSDIMEQMIREFKKSKEEERQKPEIKFSAEDLENQSDDDEKKEEKETDFLEYEAPKEKWDCESILSTYSNIYHHPKLISERTPKFDQIKISGKYGMPKDTLGKGLTSGALKQLDRENEMFRNQQEKDFETCTLASRISELSVRNKHETLEEKRQRKKDFKDLKKERRMEKKANKMAFNEEKIKQEKNNLNRIKNVPGQKLL